MRFYAGAHEYLKEAASRKGPAQRLFLVRDVGNPYDVNAVALHNGATRLGHVVRDEARGVARVLDKLTADIGGDAVIVVEINGAINNWMPCIKVKPIAYTPERPARKFARYELENRN